MIDSKVDDIRKDALDYAGNKVAVEVIGGLYRKRFSGNVIIGFPRLTHVAFLAAVATRLGNDEPALRGRVKFSVNQEGTKADSVIDALLNTVSPDVNDLAYGTGTNLAGTGFRSAIRRARERGVTFTYIWTIDQPGEITAYLHDGVRGIITDDPLRVHQFATSLGLKSAEGGAAFCR